MAEIAEMLGVPVGSLRNYMRLDPDRPQPELKFGHTRVNSSKRYYAKSVVASWWESKKKELT